MLRRKERKGKARNVGWRRKMTKGKRNLTVVTPSPQLDVVVSREFNPAGNAGFNIMMSLMLMAKKV